MGPEWITAIAAVAGLVGGASAVYARMRGDIARLEGHVMALDMEIARLVKQQFKLENLILALLGQNPRTLQDFRPDS